jgi:mono/diheme cytochrome c family protein
MSRLWFAVFVVLIPGPVLAADPAAAARGKAALTGTNFSPGFWSARAVDIVWRQWGLSAKPADFDAKFRDRYGLHPAPYPNDGLPMGLRKSTTLLQPTVSSDCMLCHGGSILGTSYVGLGNTSLDIQGLFEELAKAEGLPGKTPFVFGNVRGTSEADGFGVYLLGFRNPDLSLRDGGWKDLGLRDDLCADVPAWWLLKKKKTMYATGATDARSVRSLMQFMLHPMNGPKQIERAEPAFKDIQQYLYSLEAPKYPFAVDRDKAAKGEAVFTDHCARCHGTYGEKWTYPNKVVPLDEIGTDPTRHRGVGLTFGEAYSASWFGQEPGDWPFGGKPFRATAGYQAPPLDGAWATAPYLHNGSVPTLYGVLNSKARPRLFTRSYRTDEADYDKEKVGWKVKEPVAPPGPTAAGSERRKVYDTTQPGRSNAGHTYGDVLTDDERWAVIEYLKML